MGMTNCEGCTIAIKMGDTHCVFAEGHEAHYCIECLDQYSAWVRACEAEEARLNKLLDFFIEETRAKLTLRFVPQDLPPVRRVPDGRPLVLG